MANLVFRKEYSHIASMAAAVELFEGLGAILEFLRAGNGIGNLELNSRAAKQLVAHYSEGRPLIEAVFLVCNERDSYLSSMLFGSVKPSFSAPAQELTATADGRSLRIVLNTSTEPLEELPTITRNSAVLYTDFQSFSLYKADDDGQISKPFAMFDIHEMCEEIALTGSVWDSIYPKHYAIVSRTIAFTFPQDAVGALFSPKLGTDANILEGERTAHKRLSCLDDSILTQLLDLEAFRVDLQTCTKPPKLLSAYKEGDYTIRRYSPQRSSLLDFGEPAEELSRGDFVATYNVKDEEFHREFFISPRKWMACDQDLQLASFEILHVLAIRRTKLFRIGFASRVYNILLPPLLLTDKLAMLQGYALFPFLNLYRTSKEGFRRTLSVTFLAFPVGLVFDGDRRTGMVARPAPLEELYHLKDDMLASIVDPASFEQMRQYVVGGPTESYPGLPKDSSIPKLFRYLYEIVLRRILRGYGTDSALENLVNSTLFTSNHESRIATVNLQVEWAPPDGFSQPWERWVATGQDKVFHRALFRTLFYQDFLDPYSADASQHAIQFETFNIGNTLGADMGGMTLYNPQENLKVVLYPRAREKYPNFSIVRWMAWQIYIDSALASLRALIYKFHPLLEDRGNLSSIIGALDEMIQEFVDFYDLDLRDYFYRKEYEKLRVLMHVDSDYSQLLTKFAASKEDESLREQRLINKLILSLTIATVTITIVSTIAQLADMEAVSYLVVALVLSTIMVWIGYVLFDPIRLQYKRVFQAISRVFRR